MIVASNLGLIVLVFVILAGVLRKHIRRLLANIRFSLRTMVLAMLFLGAIGTAYLNRDPYQLKSSLPRKDITFSQPEFSPDGQRLLLLENNRILLGDLEGQFNRVPVESGMQSVVGAHFTPDGTALVAFSHDKVVRIDLASGTQTLLADCTLPIPKNTETFPGRSVQNCSADGRFILLHASTYIKTPSGGIGAASNEPQSLQVYDATARKQVAEFPYDSFGSYRAGISEDGSVVFALQPFERTTSLMVGDCAKNEHRFEPLEAAHVFQNRLVCTRDRRMTVFANLYGGLTFVDLERGRILERTGPRNLASATLSPDGTRLVTIESKEGLSFWQQRRAPGAYGPLDFPELWFALLLAALMVFSMVSDVLALRRERRLKTNSAGAAALADAKHTPAPPSSITVSRSS